VYPAVTTQYFDDMSINFEASKSIIDSLIYEGVHGIIALDTIPTLVQCIKFFEQLAGRGSEVVREPRLPLAGEERARVEKLYNEALATRIDLSKFNLV